MAKGRQAKSTAYRRRKMAPRPVERKATVPGEATQAAIPTVPGKPTTAARAASANVPVVSRGAAKEVNFAAEYHYVLSDLRRLGILAASSFAVLVILALIIR